MPPAIPPNSQPRARPRCANGYTSPIRAREIGTTPLAAAPVTTRIRMKDPAVSDSAVPAVRAANATSEPRMMGRRPIRSDSGPHSNVITPYGTR